MPNFLYLCLGVSAIILALAAITAARAYLYDVKNNYEN
jgi:hypothetical protein